MASWRDLGILIPFRPPQHMRDYQSVEMEARERNMDPWAVRAWRDGMTFFAIFLMGLPLGWLSLLGEGEGAVRLANIWSVLISMQWPYLIGLVIGIWGWAVLATLFAHNGSRFVVDLMAYTISVQPGHIIRHYAVNRWTKFVLFLQAMGFGSLYMVLMYYSLKGFFLFMTPFNVDIPRIVLIVLGLFWFGTFIVFPAVKYEPSDDRALGRYLMFKQIVITQKLRLKLLENALQIAAPHLAVKIADDIRLKGVEAVYEWTVLPPKEVAKMAQLFNLSNQVLESYSGVRAISPQKGVSYVALEDQAGVHTIVDMSRVPDWLRAKDGESGEQSTD